MYKKKTVCKITLYIQKYRKVRIKIEEDLPDISTQKIAHTGELIANKMDFSARNISRDEGSGGWEEILTMVKEPIHYKYIRVKSVCSK